MCVCVCVGGGNKVDKVLFFLETTRPVELQYSIKVSKGAKIRNRYNQVPHPTQDTNGKVTNLLRVREQNLYEWTWSQYQYGCGAYMVNTLQKSSLEPKGQLSIDI